MSSSSTRRAAAQVIVVLILVAAAAYAINSDAAGVQVYNVYPTISMLPTLEVGDLVVVHSVPFDDLKVGDVIVFTVPDDLGQCVGETVVHRIVNITGQTLITQGDDRVTNLSPDEPPLGHSWPPVPASCVRGVVVVAIPYLGRITEAFPPPYNYILVAMILIIVFALELRPKGGPAKSESSEAQGAPGRDSGAESEP